MNENKFGKKELSEAKIQQLNEMPIIKTTFKKSVDGKYVLIKTIFTEIRPIKYFEELLKRQ